MVEAILVVGEMVLRNEVLWNTVVKDVFKDLR